MSEITRLFDELGHAGAEHRDPAYVATYDRKAAVDPTGDVVRLQALGMDQSSVVVDMGAGTGSFAQAVALHSGLVVAVDVSPVMLAALAASARSRGLTNIETVRAGFLSYAHRGEPASFVYSRNALHHLPDFWKALALARIADFMRPGGALLLRDLVFSADVREVERDLAAWLASAEERSPNQGWTRAELEDHLRGEYSTFTWLLEPMLQRAGLDIVEADIAPSGVYAAYLCRKRAVPQ